MPAAGRVVERSEVHRGLSAVERSKLVPPCTKVHRSACGIRAGPGCAKCVIEGSDHILVAGI